MKGAQLRYVLIAVTVLISAILYFAPSQINKSAEKQESPTEVGSDGLDEESLLNTAKASLDSNERANLDFFEKSLEKAGGKDTSLLDGIGRLWDRNSVPAASAIWFERKAKTAPSELTFLDAAYRYFDAFRMAGDSSLKSLFVTKAIACYEKVLELNPKNLNAKTDLGACYADGTSEPMKGIMLLREVVTENPNHEMAQYNLGMLSVKSGQLDKAIDRFNKVLEINPKRNEVEFFLGQVWLQKGDTASAIVHYETFIKNASYDVSDVVALLNELKRNKKSDGA